MDCQDGGTFARAATFATTYCEFSNAAQLLQRDESPTPRRRTNLGLPDMFLSDFIAEYRLRFLVTPEQGDLHKVTIFQGEKSIESKCSITPGREFSGVAFLAVMQDSFRKLETQSKEYLLKPLSGNEAALKEFVQIRDGFRDMVGMPAFVDFLRGGRDPKTVN